MVGGVLNIYKPVGVTSTRVVERIRSILKTKAGHTGTLDPFARGVILVCWGKATRFASFFQGLDKVYRAWIRFGMTTNTYDVYGKIEKWHSGSLEKEQLLPVLAKYHGKLTQRIPCFSASKYKGKPLYQYARQDISVPVMSKEIEIYSIEVLQWEEGEFGSIELRIHCTSGTYIRSLAFELGEETGLGAYLFSLCRERVGNFSLSESIDVFRPGIEPERLLRKSLSVDQALYWIPSLSLNEEETRRFRQGNAVSYSHFLTESWMKVYHQNVFLGLGKMTYSGVLQPKIVIG